MFRRLLVICIVFVASMSAVTEASAITFPGQRTDAAVQAQVNIAAQVWTARGIKDTTYCIDPIVAYFADDLNGPDGRAIGRGAACEVWLLTTPVYGDGAPMEGGWSIRSRFDSVVEHEVGHALGLQHSDADRFPIMTTAYLPAAGDTRQNVVKKVVKKLKKAKKCKKGKKGRKCRKNRKHKKNR